MTTNLIEQAKAMAERLGAIDSIDMRDDPWTVECALTEAVALIRQLIAQIEGADVVGINADLIIEPGHVNDWNLPPPPSLTQGD